MKSDKNRKKFNFPIKIKEESFNGFTLSICKTIHFYDIILEGPKRDLIRINKKLNLDAKIILNSVFSSNLLVLDTCDIKRDAEKLLKVYMEKLCSGI